MYDLKVRHPRRVRMMMIQEEEEENIYIYIYIFSQLTQLIT